MTPLAMLSLAAAPIPSPDPLGFPAVPALMQGLAYLTLTLHFLAMMFTVGGALLMLVAYLRGDRPTQRFFATALPLGFSYLVTFGIPPLLFVQVLYGQLFYTSSVLIGGFWIMLVPLLITAYGLLYWHKLMAAERPRRWAPALVALAAMLSIGFILVNNLTLLQTPDTWLAKYGAHPGGMTLNTEEPTHGARYAFFMLCTLVVAGAAMILRGAYLRRWGHAEAGRSAARQGLTAALIGFGGAALSAAGVLAAMPPAIREFILGAGTPLWLLVAGGAFTLLALLCAVVAARGAGLAPSYAAILSLTGALACIVVLRDQVRGAYLAPHFHLADVPVHTQWGMLALFGVSLAAGLALLIVLLCKVAPPIAARCRKAA
jgi:hypothetical protein